MKIQRSISVDEEVEKYLLEQAKVTRSDVSSVLNNIVWEKLDGRKRRK
jgi:hypothetical protein